MGGLFPCAAHALRYGPRTARGIAGGLNGVVVHAGPFCAVTKSESNVATKRARMLDHDIAREDVKNDKGRMAFCRFEEANQCLTRLDDGSERTVANYVVSILPCIHFAEKPVEGRVRARLQPSRREARLQSFAHDSEHAQIFFLTAWLGTVVPGLCDTQCVRLYVLVRDHYSPSSLPLERQWLLMTTLRLARFVMSVARANWEGSLKRPMVPRLLVCKVSGGSTGFKKAADVCNVHRPGTVALQIHPPPRRRVAISRPDHRILPHK